jgi:hypothetical protein
MPPHPLPTQHDHRTMLVPPPPSLATPPHNASSRLLEIRSVFHGSQLQPPCLFRRCHLSRRSLPVTTVGVLPEESIAAAIDAILLADDVHYVKTSNRSRSICNGPLTPVTSTHICNGCCLAPVTYKRTRTTPGLASTTPVTNVTSGNRLLKRPSHKFFVTDV